MERPATLPTDVEYRIAFVSADSCSLLMASVGGAYRMPTVSVPLASRPAKELRKRIRASFGIDVLVLDICSPSDAANSFAIVEVLLFDCRSSLVPIDLADAPVPALSAEERDRIEKVIHGQSANFFGRLQWIRDAAAWLESATGHSFSPSGAFEQHNAGYGFCLTRFRMDDGSVYWLKATGDPNRHELAVTVALTKVCGEFLPSLAETNPVWNAWITVEEATRLEVVPENPKELLDFLRKAVNALAAIQIRTAGKTDMLVAAGAFDQRPAVLSAQSAALFSYIEEVALGQDSNSAPRIDCARLRELRHIFEDTCERLDAVDLPATVIHGDINLGNILVGRSHCQFIDWAEAYVGSPVATFQHLLFLNQTHDASAHASIERNLKRQYRTLLLAICKAEQIDEALTFMPLVAAFSALYGRGDWLASPRRYDARRQEYARRLTRHIDRAAREPQLLSVLRAGRPSRLSHVWPRPAFERGDRECRS